jgi:hypothetical protein
MVETSSQPKHYNLVIENPQEIKMFIHKGAGVYDEVLPVENVYIVDIPVMGGGYKKIMGIKFNESNPCEYLFIQLKKNEIPVNEYSIEKLEKCNKDNNGNYILIY